MLRRSRQVSFMRQRRKYSRTSPETCTSDILFILRQKSKFSALINTKSEDYG
jgi:hypothetical protein